MVGNLSPLSYVGIQAGELTILPALEASSFQGYAQIHDDVGYRKQLALLYPGKLAYRTETGSAKVNTGGTLPTEERWINVARIYAQEEQISFNFFTKFAAEQLKKGAQSGDLSGVEAQEALVAAWSRDRGADLDRLFWGGLTTATSGNFTTTGDYTAAIKAAFFSTVTGFIPRIMAAIGDGDVTQAATISGSPSASDIVGYLETLWLAQSAELDAYAEENKMYVVTRNIWNGLLKQRESFTGSDLSFERQNTAQMRIYYRGIELINPKIINQMQSAGDYGDYMPTSFAFLMSKDVMAIGADAYSPQASVETGYDGKSDVNWIRSKAAIGTELVDLRMIVAATSTAESSSSVSSVSSSS
jgi:hypothetical protein